MLSKKAFNNGIAKLIIEYKNLEMNKEKSDQWYEHMKDLTDTAFMKKIDACLKNCNHVPYMADVMNAKEEPTVKVVMYDFNAD